MVISKNSKVHIIKDNITTFCGYPIQREWTKEDYLYSKVISDELLEEDKEIICKTCFKALTARRKNKCKQKL